MLKYIIMLKYSQVYQLISKLTENDVLKTFYTLLLMAETEEERLKIDSKFWDELKSLPSEEQTVLKSAFREATRKLPFLTNDLLMRVKDFSVSRFPKKAA